MVLDRVVEAVLTSDNTAGKFKQFILDQRDREETAS